MRRADRLFQVVQLLRDGGVHTAAELAAELEVSERTLYRDIRDLIASGVPIEGEAGVGYVLDRGFDLPPLMFREDELEALVLGARMVEAFADPELARRAREVLSKVRAVLPKPLEARIDDVSLFVPASWVPDKVRENLEPIRQAITLRRRTRIEYERADGERSERIIQPLALYFWGQSWTLVAWCEWRDDFRNFRPDRMRAVEVLDETFPDDPDRGLAVVLAKMRAREELELEWKRQGKTWRDVAREREQARARAEASESEPGRSRTEGEDAKGSSDP